MQNIVIHLSVGPDANIFIFIVKIGISRKILNTMNNRVKGLSEKKLFSPLLIYDFFKQNQRENESKKEFVI